MATRSARLARLAEAAAHLETRARAGERRALVELADWYRHVGRFGDAVACLREAGRADPALRLRLAEWLHNLGDDAGALDAVRSAPIRTALASHWEARALLGSGRADEATAALDRGWRLASDEQDRARNIDLCLELGHFDAASERLAAELSASSSDSAGRLANAELSLWRGRHADALAAVGDLPASSSVWRIRGAAQWLAANAPAAEEALDRALGGEPIDPQAHLWRGEMLRARGELDASLAAIEAGIRATRGYPIAGHVSRLLTVITSQQRDPQMGNHLNRDAHHELLELLAPALPAGTLDGGIPDDVPAVKELLEHALARFAGNRSARASYLDDEGVLRPLDAPMHSRFAARELQERIRIRDGKQVIADLLELAEQRNHEPTIYCHIGEVQLWLGDYRDAERWFERALADTKDVRWAYVGLCASAMLRERYHEALAHCNDAVTVFPPPGRTLYAYRGELHRRLGQLDAARRDLTTMLGMTPRRISSWINLALVDSELLAATHRRLLEAAPGLMLDAHGELSMPITQPLEPAQHITLFEHLLTMMRGNRSSNFVSYFTAAGQLRFVA